MIWSFPIGRIAGTTVRIHVTFLILLAWVWFSSYFEHGFGVASRTIVFVVSVFGCVIAHEFGHVLVARLFGVQTPDVTLYPFGGIARLNTMPQQPLQEFLIAVAGPAVNVLVASALLLAAGATLAPAMLFSPLNEKIDLVNGLATVNVFIAAFNLIPAFPMDGGRLLRAGLAGGVGFERATRIAVRVGHWLALALAILGLFVNPMLIVIAIFVYFAAAAEMQAMSVRTFSKDMPVARAMISQFATLPAEATVADAVEIFLQTSQKVIPVTRGSGRLAGVLEIGDVVRALQEPKQARQPVAEMMTGDIPTLQQTAGLEEAFRLLRENSVPAVAVVDGDMRLSGLVTLETLGEMLMLHEASPSVFDHLQGRVAARPLVPRSAG